MRNKFIYSILFLLSAALNAQEGLRPLSRNNALSTEVNADKQEQGRKALISLQLPFKDDFSYASKQVYPSSSRWSDNMVFINSGFGRNPQSIGVATFDGLNSHGYPYVPGLPNLNNSEPADTLTSLPIDLHVISATSKTLQPSDSVALVFYYQARGWGENPESGDSLILDFYKPRQDKWESKVWFSRGNLNGNVKDTVFKYVMVRITDTAYFDPAFRFRFRNRATTAGNYDHWNLDYIYLDQRLAPGPPVFDDITFAYVPTSFLKDYSAMPYQQYQISEVAENLSVKIRNNSPSILTMSYLFDMYNTASVQAVYNYDGGPVNLSSYTTSGYSKHAPHATPSVSAYYTFPAMTDSTDYLIKHYVKRSGSSPGNDFNYENDTVYQYQRFRNYFAYDDGSAEAGYYVKGVGSRIAVKVKLNVPDSLRAVRIYFDPAGKVLSTGINFNIKVWADGGNGPGSEIRSEGASEVKYYKDGFKGVPEYSFSPLYLTPGTYYIGFQQKIATGITVGYDLNYNFSRNMFYDDGSGWKQSTLGGAIMLRPVFGAYVPPPPVGLQEHLIGGDRFVVYPNPASDVVTIEGTNESLFSVTLFNSLGQIVLKNDEDRVSHSINTADLSNGVYFLHIQSGKNLSRQKVLVQH